MTFLGYFPNFENVMISKTGEVIRAGRRDIAEFLLARALKNEGYGLNEFYVPALNSQTLDGVREIKKASCTKKAFAINNISPIHCACLNPNADILAHLLSVNPEFTNMDDSLRKPVHYAACCESPEPLKYLATQNIDTREHDNMRTTPLMYAARAGRAENVRFLLEENRSNPPFKDRHGYAAFHYAAEAGHIHIIKIFLEAGTKISFPGPEKKTALHIAAAQGNFEMVEFLVQQGAKVIGKDKFKRSPLLLACKNGNLKVASFLLQHGSLFDEPDSSANTPLHYACAYGYPEIIEALFKAGANPNAVNSWNLSPTAVALLKSYFSCLRKMLDNEATDVNCVDDEGRTLVSNAIKTISAENFNHVSFLLKEKKACPNIPDAKGLTAFDYLCSHNIESLIESDLGSDQTLERRNALRAEKRSLYKKYIKLFLDAGADINHRDTTGLTPIFRALQANNPDAVNMLLEEKHLELNIISKTNNTIYHSLDNMVCQDNFLSMVKKLLEKCNHPDLLNRYNNNGKTALHVLFHKFVSLIPNLKNRILNSLENELKLKKRREIAGKMDAETGKPKTTKRFPRKAMADEQEDEDEEEDEPMEDERHDHFKHGRSKPYRGLKGGARMKMKYAKRKYTEKGGSRNDDDEDDEENPQYAELSSIAITAEERFELTQEAENQLKDRISEFVEFMNFFCRNGADSSLLMKNPRRERELVEGNLDMEIKDEYDLLDYFEKLNLMVEQAIESKIDLPAKKKPDPSVGYSLLHIAVQIPNLHILQQLVEELKIPLNLKSVYGETELLKFIESNSQSKESLEVLEYLVKKGAMVELANKRGVTPLLFSIVQSKYEFAGVLLRYRANVNCQDVDGNYPLLQAIKNKHLTTIELLIRHKANPNLFDANRRNSIHWAINLSNVDADASNEIENVLLSSGGDLNAVDARGRTPLHYAFVKIGNPFNSSNIDPIETVSNIISREHVAVDVRDKWGNTPLNYAAQRGAVISALYLMNHEANINNVNADGNTPLHECLLNGHQNMTIFMIQKNAELKMPVKIKTEEQKRKEMEESASKHRPKDEDGEDEDEDEAPQVFGYGGMHSQKQNYYKRPAKRRRRGMDEESKKDEVEYESSESVLDDKDDDEAPEEDLPVFVQQQPTFGFGVTSSFGGRFSMAHQKVQQSQPMSDLAFGPKETECSTFSIAIRRNWQSVAFLMLEYKFDLSLAILDCFNHRKYNYVYTLLLKKSEAGVYQMKNSLGQNLTHLFSKNSNNISPELYQKILDKLEAKQLDFTSLDSFGKNALHYACESGCLRLIKHLVEKRINPNISDKAGMTPLGYIAVHSFHHTVDFCSAAKSFGLDLDKRFRFGKKEHTILTFIISQGKSFDVFTRVHELGADLNKGDCDGWVPLVYYIRENRDEEAKNFIKSFKSTFMRTKDAQGRTLIHHVVRPREFGAYENVQLLEFLAHYADVNEPDNQGHPPLYYAKQQASGKMAKALLKCKARDQDMEPAIVRTTTVQLDNLEFPKNPYNFEEDFEKFLEQAKQEAEKVQNKFEERCQPDSLATGNYEVCYDGADPYDCYMVKVDISMGYYSGNTFYKMQILREKVRDVYILFTRWGRVGTDGQYQQTPFSKVEEARKEFCSVFKSKSGNQWEDRHQFVKVDKKYRLVPQTKKTRFESFLKAFNYKDPRLPPSNLDRFIFKLIRRLCNYKVISNAIKTEYRIDESVVPLQSLTKDRLLDAEAIVKGLTTALENYEKARSSRVLAEISACAEELTKLTSLFYELLPSTRFRQEAIPPITSVYQLSELRKMLNDLLYFEVAIKLLCAASYNLSRVNPVDYIFLSLTFKVIHLDSQSEEYQVIR
jgi:ankyrin repeat protein/predicted DNA-binding WGR domain protein